jgi:hypothetical protein
MSCKVSIGIKGQTQSYQGQQVQYTVQKGFICKDGFMKWR